MIYLSLTPFQVRVQISLLVFYYRFSDFVWTVGDKHEISTFEVDQGHKVTVLVVPKFYLTSEFTIVTFDPESNGITTDVASLDFDL